MSDIEKLVKEAEEKILTQEEISEFEERIKKREIEFHEQAVRRGTASPLDRPHD